MPFLTLRRYLLSQAEDEVTAEEMEAYRIKKARADDPMNDMAASASTGYAMV